MDLVSITTYVIEETLGKRLATGDGNGLYRIAVGTEAMLFFVYA